MPISELQPIWENGEFLPGKEMTFKQVVDNIGLRKVMPE